MNGPRFAPPFLEVYGGIHGGPVEAGKHLSEEFEVLLGRNIPVQEDPGVRRRVEGPVECPELFVGQIGDRLRIPPRVAGVGGLGIEVFLEGLVHQGLRRGVGPLHLVVHDPGDGQLAVCVEFEVVALLEEGLLQEPRPENQVGVDPGEVEEVAPLLAGDGVDRLVGVGEGVDERLERSPEQFVEDVLERIALRARQDGVLEDVGNAGRIARRGAEPDGEEVFPVVAVEVEDSGPRFFVFDLVGGDPDFRDLLDPPYMKSLPLIPRGKRRGGADAFCDSCSFPSVSVLRIR